MENGALVLNGQRYDTPSAAAMSITGSPVNSWTFWECRMPGSAAWQMIKARRPQKSDKNIIKTISYTSSIGKFVYLLWIDWMSYKLL